MRLFRLALAVSLVISMAAAPSWAGGGRRGSSGRGTGSKSSSTHVRSYTRSNGTRVQSHRRSTQDRSFSNNYSTKGNTNPYTGKKGTRVNPRR